MDFREFVEGKSWEAKRDDIVKMWHALRPYMPLEINPIPWNHMGTRYDNDGLRITGSPSFINSILSRMKDFLDYEMRPGYELDVEYRQVATRQGEIKGKPAFVCYVHVVEKPPQRVKPAAPKKMPLHGV